MFLFLLLIYGTSLHTNHSSLLKYHLLINTPTSLLFNILSPEYFSLYTSHSSFLTLHSPMITPHSPPLLTTHISLIHCSPYANLSTFQITHSKLLNYHSTQLNSHSSLLTTYSILLAPHSSSFLVKTQILKFHVLDFLRAILVRQTHRRKASHELLMSCLIAWFLYFSELLRFIRQIKTKSSE